MAAQSRPEPMNASPYHSKVKVTVRLSDPLYVAGSTVAGKLEMECKADKGLGIGAIMAELIAIEELTSRDHSATSTFLCTQRFFQGPGLPPSNSVHPYPLPGEPPLPAHYYPARRGISTFIFHFPIPESAPSSINFGSGLANVRYEIRASVGVAWRGENRLVTDKKEVEVAEQFEEDFARVEPEAVVVGENGKIWVQGRVIGGVLISGQPTCIELQVKNHSSKKNTGLAISLTRDLHLANQPTPQKPPLEISDTLTSVSFRGREYIIPPGVEGVANLVFDVPKGAKGVKGGRRQGSDRDSSTGSLFEVRCIVSVKIMMGIGSKDIILDIPVIILHSAALPSLPELAPPAEIYDYAAYPQDAHAYDPPLAAYYPPASPIPYYNRPISPYGYPLSPVSPPIIPYVDQGQVWLPPPIRSPLPYPPSSAVQNHYYMHPPALISNYAPPPRPSSAEPKPSVPLHGIPPGLPLSAVQQPLVPLMTGGYHAQSAEREEGKGERASRTTHHLRMSSRHRSVSPPSHRFPPSAPAEFHPPNIFTDTHLPSPHLEAASQSHYRSASPLMDHMQLPPATETLFISSTLSAVPLVSPRPILSPKHSFSVDPVTHVTLSKSERVETLERIAARADKENADMSSGSTPGVMAPERDKTLPNPPVPTRNQRSADVASHVNANLLFPPEPVQDTPPTPTLAAVASLKVARSVGGIGGGGLTGLDALEARLSAEVGTRNFEKERRPDVRAVLPISIPRSADVVDAANDSAISSLTLPGIGSDEKTLLGEGQTIPNMIGEGEITRSGPKSMREHQTDDRTVRRERPTGDSPGKDKEVSRLRKAAFGRVAAWLGSIEPDVSPPLVITPPESPVQPTSAVEEPFTLEDKGDITPVQKPTRASPMPTVAEVSTNFQPDVSAAPNPRSSGFVPIGSLKPEKSPVFPALAEIQKSIMASPTSRPEQAALRPDPEVRYDIRSARGGRGGKVTTVAAMWASAAEKQGISRQPQRVTKPNAISSKPANAMPLVRKTVEPPWMHVAPPSGPAAQSSGAASSSRADPPARRMQVTKSPSIPTVSSSLATPMISSTASLARPSPASPNANKTRLKLPPMISEMETDTKRLVVPKAEAAQRSLAFGQARLRELINRYQTQTNA